MVPGLGRLDRGRLLQLLYGLSRNNLTGMFVWFSAAPGLGLGHHSLVGLGLSFPNPHSSPDLVSLLDWAGITTDTLLVLNSFGKCR